MRMLKADMAKLIGNYKLYISILGVAAGYLADTVQILLYDKEGMLENIFFQVTAGGNSLLCFVLAAVCGSYMYCAEEKNGGLFLAVSRCGRGCYSRAKTVTAACGGFVTAFWGQCAYICILIGLLAARYGTIHVIDGESEILIELGMDILLLSVRCMIFSVIAFVATTVYPNFFVGMITPLIVHYFLLFLLNYITVPDFLHINVIFHYNVQYWGAPWKQLTYSLLFGICCCLLLEKGAQRGIQRRLEHG